MNTNIDLNVPALEKLLDIVASVVGSIAGPMLASWRAQQENKAMQIKTKGEADALLIQAKAQSEARQISFSSYADFMGDLDIVTSVRQRIQFQEQT